MRRVSQLLSELGQMMYSMHLCQNIATHHIDSKEERRDATMHEVKAM